MGNLKLCTNRDKSTIPALNRRIKSGLYTCTIYFLKFTREGTAEKDG